jgi:hypothetical protein
MEGAYKKEEKVRMTVLQQVEKMAPYYFSAMCHLVFGAKNNLGSKE